MKIPSGCLSVSRPFLMSLAQCGPYRFIILDMCGSPTSQPLHFPLEILHIKALNYDQSLLKFFPVWGLVISMAHGQRHLRPRKDQPMETLAFWKLVSTYKGIEEPFDLSWISSLRSVYHDKPFPLLCKSPHFHKHHSTSLLVLAAPTFSSKLMYDLLTAK